MLIVLVGSLLNIGYLSREYFASNGYKLIEKFTHTEDAPILKARYDLRNEESEVNVNNLDYTYRNNNMLIGFNYSQISDAIIGDEKSLLTITPESYDFVREIKSINPSNIIVIGLYVECSALNELCDEVEDMSLLERNKRIITCDLVKKEMLHNRSLFDYIVFFGGNNSVFNNEGVLLQYSDILDNSVHVTASRQ